MIWCDYGMDRSTSGNLSVSVLIFMGRSSSWMDSLKYIILAVYQALSTLLYQLYNVDDNSADIHDHRRHFPKAPVLGKNNLVGVVCQKSESTQRLNHNASSQLDDAKVSVYIKSRLSWQPKSISRFFF